MIDVYVEAAPISLAACRKQCWESKTCYGVHLSKEDADGNGLCVNWLKADIKGRCTDPVDNAVRADCEEK